MKPFLYFVAVTLMLSVSACGDNPPKPVLPDGLHRLPVNRAPGSDTQPAVTPAMTPAATAVIVPLGARS